MTELMRRRRALMGAASQGGGLPAEYQQVEWIGATSQGPFIATNATASNDSIEYKLKIAPSSTGTYGRYAFGIIPSNSGAQNPLYLFYRTDHTLLFSSSSNTITTIPIADGKIIEASFFVGGANTTASWSASGESDGQPFSYSGSASIGDCSGKKVSIFGSSATGGTVRFVGKIYYAKVINGGKTILDALPCYRKADGVIGMFDLVSKTFYTNSGSGTLTKGGDVNV